MAGKQTRSPVATLAILSLVVGVVTGLVAAAFRIALEHGGRSAYTGPISGDTDFHVLLNGREIFGSFLPREGSASFSDMLSLLAGDTVDFVIGRGADNSYHGSGLIIDATLRQLRTPGQ